MSINVRPYHPDDAEAWDEFCKGALQGTLLHTRRFISYHGERFEDWSLIIESGQKWLGLFPAAYRQDGAKVVVSHPGLSYGGILHHRELGGQRMIEAMTSIGQFYAAQGFARLVYKAVPAIYHQVPAQDDLYALYRLGAKRTQCELSSTIDLHHRLPTSERRRRGLKRAIKAGIKLVEGKQHIEALWDVLSDNLARKHGLTPVHSLDEIEMLLERFPESISCVCGVIEDTVVAGTLLFITPTASHAQYVASSKTGYDISALDAVFEHCIGKARQQGKRWFDFGVSTEEKGWVLNEGLHQFKSEFGAGGTTNEFYELDLLKEERNGVE